METAGEFLRKRREASGKTLEEISRETRMKREVLRNLEADLFSFATAEVYIRGALTAYAKALGLDPAEVLERHRERTAPGERPVLEEPEPAVGGLSRSLRIGMAAAAVVIVLALVLVLGRRGPSPEGESAAPTVLSSPPETVVVDLPSRGASEERVVLELSVQESTWVGLEMDRAHRYTALLPPGAWRRWEADSVFAITIGNAGGVTLTLDGEPVDLPRVLGRVVILELPGRRDRDRTVGGHARPAVEDSTGGRGL